ncbi:hypothetical protein MA16_Dca025693 [Dendrobium catenatum]|uniref:Uncharacterized protein n=1 Tax=Dendrobium catenatum TaxID=906689 RepID=A0A2I0W2T0_9ASPA|nr:hypothetical protein MA16_Dca025693 [Dendrobium catenatum]
MQTERFKIGLIIQNDITIIPADQFKSEENRPEHCPEFKLSDPDRPEVTKSEKFRTLLDWLTGRTPPIDRRLKGPSYRQERCSVLHQQSA